MARMSITERAAALERRADEINGAPLAPGGDLHPVHVATVDVLTDLMNLGREMSGGGQIPSHLRVMMTMLDKGRPMLLDGIAKLDPAGIVDFMRQLEEKIHRIVVTPIGGDSDHHNGTAAEPRSDLAAGA